MFTNKITQTYNHIDATMEILILLTGAFLLGLLTCWLLRKTNKNKPSENTLDIQTTSNHQISQKKSPSLHKEEKITLISKQADLIDAVEVAPKFAKIKGMNSGIEKSLIKGNIRSYEDLRDIDKTTFEKITSSPIFGHIPKNELKTWPHQAALASKKEWRKLSEYQDFIHQAMISEKEIKHTHTIKKNDLKKIKGIGPQIEKILNNNGIFTYIDLRKADATTLKKYISDADPRFNKNQTSTWSHQASIAEKSKWKELSIYQEFMGDININTGNLDDINTALSEQVANSNDELRSTILDKNQLSSQNSNEKHFHYKSLSSKTTGEHIPEKPTIVKDISNSDNDDILEHDISESIDEQNVHYDDLTKIKGIDIRTQTLLNDNAIYTFQQLHKNNHASLSRILENAGKEFQHHTSKSWPHQAGMAARSEWNELHSYQKIIIDTSSKHETPPQLQAVSSSAHKPYKDDLKKIEGIGPKIENILNKAKILSFNDLKNSNRDALKSLLNNAGPQYRMHEPESWPKQAELAQRSEWEKLRNYQNQISGRG